MTKIALIVIFIFSFGAYSHAGVRLEGNFTYDEKSKIENVILDIKSKVSNELLLPENVLIKKQRSIYARTIYKENTIYIHEDLPSKVLFQLVFHEYGHLVYQLNIENFLEEHDTHVFNNGIEELYADLFSLSFLTQDMLEEDYLGKFYKTVKNNTSGSNRTLISKIAESGVYRCRYYNTTYTENKKYYLKSKNDHFDSHQIYCPSGSYLFHNFYGGYMGANDFIELNSIIKNYLVEQSNTVDELFKKNKKYKLNKHFINHITNKI